MTKENIAIALSTIALVGVLFMGMVGNQPVQDGTLNVGASGSRFPNGLSTDSTSPSTGELRTTTLTTTGATTMGGDLTITTANSATSSVQVGCIDTFATSTETAIRLSPTTTPSIAYWSYGACSSL